MSLRLLEIVVPEDRAAAVQEALDARDLVGTWRESEPGDRLIIRAVVPAQRAEPIMDRVEQRLASGEGYRLLLLPVEASLPRVEEEQQQNESENEAALSVQRLDGSRHRIGREELYADVEEGTRITPVFLAMTILSTIVAGVGLVRNDLAVVIGAMVIAPLLGPNISLALATTLGDPALMKRALKANVAGFALASAIAIGLGLILAADPDTPAIAARSRASLSDIALALAAGAAGTLAFTGGLSATLIGVMVAVALLPPLVTAGLLLGDGHFRPAGGAFLLVVVNVISLNLAGVMTFMVQGVRPRTWWKAERARRATRLAILLWAVLLAVLVVALVLVEQVL